MKEQAPSIEVMVKALSEEAQNHAPKDPVEPEFLLHVLKAREALASELDSFSIMDALFPTPEAVADALLLQRKMRETMADVFARVPDGCHDFLTAHIQSWRVNRLFGSAEPEATERFDLRGRDCVV